MSKYTGSQCMVCQNLFKDTDDVVVCPECGTPYHRSCYREKGACINVSLHTSGKSWQEVQEQHRKKLGGTECPRCHQINLPDAESCSVCGTSLQKTVQDTPQQNTDGPQVMVSRDGQTFFNAMDPCCGMSPDEEIGGERLEDVAHFVKHNTLYYIPLFKRFQESKSKLSINLPCVFFPYLYFANRKMWLMTILTILVSLICNIPSFLLNFQGILSAPDFFRSLQDAYASYGAVGEQVVESLRQVLEFLNAHDAFLGQAQTVAFLVGLCVHFLLCLFGNWLYYRFVLKRVRKIRTYAPSPEIKNILLSTSGGTSFWNMIGAMALYYAGMLGGVFVLYAAFMALFL